MEGRSYFARAADLARRGVNGISGAVGYTYFWAITRRVNLEKTYGELSGRGNKKIYGKNSALERLGLSMTQYKDLWWNVAAGASLSLGVDNLFIAPFMDGDVKKILLIDGLGVLANVGAGISERIRIGRNRATISEGEMALRYASTRRGVLEEDPGNKRENRDG